MSIPQVGEIIEDAGGKRWRVQGVHLTHFEAEDDYPEGWAFHVDVQPVTEPVPIPEAIRREFER